MKHLYSSILACVLLISCRTTRIATNTEMLYKAALRDAMIAEEHEIDTNLYAITSDSVLVLTWVSCGNKLSCPGIDTMHKQTWVTVVPELKERLKHEKKVTVMRLQQLLGLRPADSTKPFFLEFKVKAADLFRPCLDSEITDKTCGLPNLDAQNVPLEHRKWLKNMRQPDDGVQKYPFTALGYTYDWNEHNKKHRGLSEFVVKENSVVRIIRFVTTKDYIDEIKTQ